MPPPPKNSKRKWAKDPNNTAWSRNTDTFAQKIMRSQGWAPGEYLGAKDASHSEFFGAANASHIRAVMKDDNMGLGAKRNQGDECTGLDALQDLLSRLNGKSDAAVGEDRRKREETKMGRYLERKLGTVRFVFGGLLVGDKVQELADSLKEKDQGAARVPGQEDGGDAAAGPEEGSGKKEKKKSKRRRAEDGEDEQQQKKDKKSKKRKADKAGDGDEDDDSKSRRRDKKEKKEKKRKDKEAATDGSATESPDDTDEAASARKKSKKEKKEKRRKSKDDDNEEDDDEGDLQSKDKKKKRKADDSSEAPTTSSTPTASGISTPVFAAVPHRHLARSRFIAQKRAAVMDQAALNQIFMIKA